MCSVQFQQCWGWSLWQPGTRVGADFPSWEMKQRAAFCKAQGLRFWSHIVEGRQNVTFHADLGCHFSAVWWGGTISEQNNGVNFNIWLSNGHPMSIFKRYWCHWIIWLSLCWIPCERQTCIKPFWSFRRISVCKMPAKTRRLFSSEWKEQKWRSIEHRPPNRLSYRRHTGNQLRFDWSCSAMSCIIQCKWEENDRKKTCLSSAFFLFLA